MEYTQLCNKCGLEEGSDSPDNGTTWWGGVCDKCKEKGYVTSPRDFGVCYGETDEGVKKLMDLLNGRL